MILLTGLLVVGILFLIFLLSCFFDFDNQNIEQSRPANILRPLSQINNYGSPETNQRMENDILEAGYKIDGYDILNQRGQVVYTAEPVARGLNVWALSDNEQRYNLVGTVPKRNYYMYLLNHENILMYDPQNYRIF